MAASLSRCESTGNANSSMRSARGVRDSVMLVELANRIRFVDGVEAGRVEPWRRHLKQWQIRFDGITGSGFGSRLFRRWEIVNRSV